LTNSNVGGLVVTGATGSSFRPSTATAGTFYYYCVVESAGGTLVTSSAVTITVTAAIITHTITASAGENGTISPSGSVSVTDGGSQAFTITPSNGYRVVSVLVDGSSVGAVTTYTFTNVTANRTISATFEEISVVPDPTPSNPDPTPSQPSYTPPTPAPTPTPAEDGTSSMALPPEENPYVIPSMNVEQTETGTQYTAANGASAAVTVTENNGVKVEAGVNQSGSVNSQSTAAAVAEAAAIAQANGETTVAIDLPEGTVGLSKSTVEKLIAAAGDTEVVVNIPTVVDGETVGSVFVPLTSGSGQSLPSRQILTGMTFDTSRTESVENYVRSHWNTEVLGSFETAQKGGWGGTATLTIGLDKLDISAEDGTELYALIYDTKAKKWYQVEPEIENGNVVIKTKRSGIVTIVTNSVK
jgi:hypothetical protein